MLLWEFFRLKLKGQINVRLMRCPLKEIFILHYFHKIKIDRTLILVSPTPLMVLEK